MTKKNSRKGSVTVFICIFFVTLVSLIFAFAGVAKKTAVSSATDALCSLWADSILAEYDLNLQKRYNIFGFYGYPEDVRQKIAFYAGESFKEKRYIDYGNISCSLYEYSLANVDVLKEQIVKAGELAFTEKFVKPVPKIKPTEQSSPAEDGDGVNAVNREKILEDLPSEGSSKGFSVSKVTGLLNRAGSAKDVIKTAGEAYFVNRYISAYFKNQADEKNLGKTFLNLEEEYIICGKKSDEANSAGMRRKLTGVREVPNLLYLNQNEVKRSEALAAAELLTPGPPAMATQQAILTAWALAESNNDYKLLCAGHRVPWVKTDASWAVDLQSVLSNKESGYIFTGVDEGDSYEDYLHLFTYAMDDRVRLLRIMDIIQMNMRYMYYDSFLLREYNGGMYGKIEVNGEEHEMVKTY